MELKKNVVLGSRILSGLNTLLPNGMHVREFIQNTFDNFNENKKLNKNNFTYMLPVIVDGCKKFCVADNGTGITNHVFFNNVMKIGNSDKVDNFCWGGNISTAKNNKRGVLYVTYASDGFHCYIITKENKELVGFEISSEEVMKSLSGDAFDEIFNKIKKNNHGTMVVFLGNTETDNTCIGIEKDDELVYRASASKFVCRRFGSFPENTTVYSYPLDGGENSEWIHRKLMTNDESFYKWCDKKHSFKVKNGKYSAIAELGYIKQGQKGNSGHNFCESGLYIIENIKNEVIQHYAYNRGGSGISNDKNNWRVIGEEYFGIKETQNRFIVRLIVDCNNVEQNVFRNGFEDENGEQINFIDIFSEEVKKKLPNEYIKLFGIINKNKKKFNNNQNRKNMNERIHNTMATMNYLGVIDNGEPIHFSAKSLKLPRDSKNGEGEGLGKHERSPNADGRGIGINPYGSGERKTTKNPRNSKKIKTKCDGKANGNTIGEMLPQFNATSRGIEYPMLEFKKSSVDCPFGEIRMNTTSEEVQFYLSKIRQDKIACQVDLTDDEIMEDIQERFEEICTEMFISTISLEAKRQHRKFRPDQLASEASKKLTVDAFYDVFMLQTTEHFKAICAKSKNRKSKKTNNSEDKVEVEFAA